jgi:hypothetical protein
MASQIMFIYAGGAPVRAYLRGHADTGSPAARQAGSVSGGLHIYHPMNNANLDILGRLEADRLSDEHDVDAPGRFLVDLEDLPDAAVLAIGGLGASILERQAVLVDPLMSVA